MSTSEKDPRVRIQSYVIHPSCYETMVNSDRDHWNLTVTDGGRWGWSVRGSWGGSEALNRKGEWVIEMRGSNSNRFRRWSRDEALALALRWVDHLRMNGVTAQEASDRVAAQVAAQDGAA